MSAKTPVVALAFPSLDPVISRRRMESKAKAQRFGEVRNLGESSLVAKDTFGYVVEASAPVQFMSDATASGGRIIQFKEFSAPGKSGGYGGDHESQGTTEPEMKSGSNPGKSGGYPGTANSQGRTEPEMKSGGTPGKSGGYPSGETSHGVTDSQGCERGGSTPKNTDDARGHSTDAKAKAKAGDYGASDSKSKARGLKEGIWVKIAEDLPAFRVEMSGTQPIGEARKGQLHAGNYFVLGIQEAKDGAVVTLGEVDKLHDIGNKEKGKFLYNVDADSLARLLGVEEMSDVSKAGDPGGGGVVNAAKQYIAKSGQSKGKKGKKEGILGAMSGAAQTPQRESHEQVTTESAHSRGIQLLRKLKYLDGGEQPSATTAAGQTLLAENAGNSSQPVTKAIPATHATPASGQQAAMLEAAVGGGTGGKLSGGPFDMPLDPGLENKLSLFRSSVQTNAHMMQNQGVTPELIQEAQLRDVMATPSADPAAYALRHQLKMMLKEEDIDIDDLSEEEIKKLLADLDNAADNTEESDEDDTEEPRGGLFEDLEPGDVAKLGGMASLLKARGYPNAEEIARHVEAGHAANEWFGLTGGSLQDAKRLQWLHVQAGQKGHF